MINNENQKSYLKNALVLAYLGDSVFTLMVRDFLVKTYDMKANALNKRANSVVCAKTQAEFMEKLKPELNDDELDVIMRARNSHINNKAKNSSFAEYSMATQFEALVGYWYLNGDTKKLNEMFNSLVKEKL